MKLKYWNNSLCTYMKSKEKSVYDKWLYFKIPKMPGMKYILFFEKYDKNINEWIEICND